MQFYSDKIEDFQEFVKKFKEFESQSYNRFKSLFDQIKKDRSFIAGKQNDETDKTILDSDFGTPVPSLGLNVVQNAIRTIVNSYIPNQYKWSYNLVCEEQVPQNNNLNKLADQFLSDVDNSTACVEALTNAVGTALGVLVFSNDYEIDGSIKPILYSIPDVTNVRLDPNASKLNFADATKAAIVELKSREWIEKNYGISSFTEFDKPLIDISEEYDRKSYLPLVTYYVKENDVVTCYKLCGNDLVEEPINLPYSYIPVVPVFGEQTWTEDNKQSWSGITTIMRPIQRMINYSYRQIILRAAKVPKNTFIGGSEALQGREKYWRNYDKTLNNIAIYNDYSADKKRKLEPPQRIDNEIHFNDVSQLMQNSLSLTNSIAGIPATGLESDVEKTATEVLTNQEVFNNNVRNYLYHLKYSMQLIGLLYAEELYGQSLYGRIKVTVIAGPDDAMMKQKARVQLNSYAPFVTSDEDKRKLLVALCNIENDNQYINIFGTSLGPQPPSQNEIQSMQMVENANNEIKARDQKILDLEKQLNDMRLQQQLQAYSVEQQLLLNKQKHENEKDLMILKAQLEQSNPANEAETVADIEKSQAEVKKAQMSVEKEAISLRKEEIKAAQNPIPVDIIPEA